MTFAQKAVLGFALLCVAVTSGFVIFMTVQLTEILSAPDWCVRAINAEKLAEVRRTTEFAGCPPILMKQIGSLALNSHILVGIIALCLLVLVVIVVAGARLDVSVNKEGASAKIDREPVPVTVVNAPSDPVPVEEPKP